jgi:Flp pilus assembly CpaE family ATPase
VSSADVSQNFGAKHPDTIGAKALSVALIGPDERRRTTLNKALAETRLANVRAFNSYPPKLDHLQRLLRSFDVILLDADSNPDLALEMVERGGGNSSATIMVFSEKTDQNLAVRFMRAGAREYLSVPVQQGELVDALVRAASGLGEKILPAEKTHGKLLVFVGSKGGCGVTTVACNVAIGLAQNPDQRILLIDFALPIGDAALCLGIAADYSTEDALRKVDRLDANSLQNLLVKHRSGVFVLAAPTKVPEVEVSKGAVERLITIARREFDHVVVDVGSRIDVAANVLFEDASTIYLVTQTGISELRNSNRLISQFFTERGSNLEIVINRFDARQESMNEDVVAKALGRPVRWKIPDDQDAARALQSGDSGLPDTGISHISLEMASSIAGHPVTQERNRDFDLSGMGRTITQVDSGNNAPASTTTFASSDGRMTPTITWPTPDPITYGDKLTTAQLNATASVAGAFVYTPGSGYVLPVGTHTLWVTFTPADANGNAPIQSAISIVVGKAKPALSWPAPAEIGYGTALGNAQLNASAPVPGSFDYSPAPGEVLSPGTHTLSVTFTPADSANYVPAQTSVSLTVARSTCTIQWPTPDPIMYGTQLSNTQLCATASVPGSFDYSPALGEVLLSGSHTLSVTFTPADSVNFAPSQATVSLNVTKAAPAMQWSTPDPITYGTQLSNTQLSAVASVPGTFEYNPGLGAALASGVHSLSVIFTPADTQDYSTSQTTVSLTVAKATPAITWPMPDSITHGVALSAKQLNAAATIAGSFAYAPAAGEILPPGVHKLAVTFTPTDTLNYTTVRAVVSLTVTEKLPTQVTWPVPAAISYGTALSAAQLNATASVPGTFVYTPAAGHVLAPGRYTLTATFAPSDTEKYATAQAAVVLEVEALHDIASSINAATQTPSTRTFSASRPAPADSAPAEVKGGRANTKSAPHETRVYQGAVYEKGPDGKWHLLKD